MSLTERKQREKLHRRETIIKAARDLFFEKGYSTTMEEIAERAELSKGTLYIYFNSKDELYISVIMEGFRILEERLEKALSSREDVEAKLRTIYRTFVDHCLDNREYFRITQYFLTEDARRNTSRELVDTINIYSARLLQIGVGVLEEGVDSGLFRKDLNPTAFSVIAWRTATGLLDLAMVEETVVSGAGSYGDLFEVALDLLLEGAKGRVREGVD